MLTTKLVPGDSFGQAGLTNEEFDRRFANVAASDEGSACPVLSGPESTLGALIAAVPRSVFEKVWLHPEAISI